MVSSFVSMTAGNSPCSRRRFLGSASAAAAFGISSVLGVDEVGKGESAVTGDGNRVTVAIVDPGAGIDPRLPAFLVVTYEAKVVEEPGLPLMALTLNGEEGRRDLIVEALGGLRNNLELLRKPLKVDVRQVGNVAVPPKAEAETLAVAILLRSVILGDRLDDGIVAAATVNVKQDPDLGLYRLYGYSPVNLEAILAAGFSRVVIPGPLGGLVDDYAVRGEWASLHGSQVWTAGTFEDLYELFAVEDDQRAPGNPADGQGREGENSNSEEVAQRFKETQALLLERGMSMAANPHVMERVTKMLEIHPDHHTANLYRRYGEGAPPKHLSRIGSAEGLRAFFYREVMPVFRDLPNLEDADVRDKKRDLRDRLTDESRNVHPDAKGIVTHLEGFEDFMTRFSQSDAATIPATATDFDAWRNGLDVKVEAVASVP